MLISLGSQERSAEMQTQLFLYPGQRNVAYYRGRDFNLVLPWEPQLFWHAAVKKVGKIPTWTTGTRNQTTGVGEFLPYHRLVMLFYRMARLLF